MQPRPRRRSGKRIALGGALRGHAAAMVKSLSWNIRLAAAVLLVIVAAGSAGAGYWLGKSTEAAKYVQVPAALDAQLTAPNAAQWINLMRWNDIGKAARTCSPQDCGVACSISLWVEPPPAQGG